MAKKKTSQKKEAAPMAEPANDRTTTSNGREAVHETTEAPPRDPSPDKTEKLKQLNEILLKQTKEKREQVSQLQSQIEEMGFDFSFASETERDVMHVILSSFVINLGIEINEKLREMAAERQKEVERGIILEEKVESLKEEVQTEIEKGGLAEKEKAVILGQLDVKEKEVVEMEKLVKELEMVKSDIEKRFLNVCEEKEALMEEGKEKEGLICNLRNEKNDLEAILGESKKLVEKLKSKVEEEVQDKELQMSLLKNEKEALEAKIVTLQQEHMLEIGMLSSQTEALNQKSSEKEGEIRDLKVSIDDKNDKIVGLEKEIDILQLAVEEANKEVRFWSWICPVATTILAAISISLFCVAKAR